jgi:hypothetical protein
MGGGRAPFGEVNEPKKTGARSAQAHARPLISRNSSLKLAEEARDDFSNQIFTTPGSSTNSRRQIDEFSNRKRQEAYVSPNTLGLFMYFFKTLKVFDVAPR